MSDFVVKIDTAKRSDKQAAQVAGGDPGRRHAGARETGPGPAEEPTGAITFHPEWRGIWLRSFKELQKPGVEVPVLQVVERGVAMSILCPSARCTRGRGSAGHRAP